MPKLYLIDGMSVVFRAYHAMLRSGLKSPEGEPTGAVFGFVNILSSLLDKEKPEKIAVVFDTDHPTFRHEMYPEYKANRDAFPEDLVPQLEKIKQFIDLINMSQVEKPGYEADDVIGTLSKKASDGGWEVICITSDKDYYQLVNDKVTLMKPGRKGNDFEIVDVIAVEEKFGVGPDKVIEILALKGDASDNVPGVKGIGDKTAAPLIKEYNTIENLYDNLENIEKASVKNKLDGNKELAVLSKKLVTIDIDVPLDITFDKLEYKTPDYKTLDNFFESLGFNTLRAKWRIKGINEGIKYLDETDDKSAENEIKEFSNYKTIENVDHEYIFVDTKAKFDKMLEYIKTKDLISFDLETGSLNVNNTDIVGIALSVDEFKGYYIPVYDPFDTEEEEEDEPEEIQSLFGSGKKKNSNTPEKIKWQSDLPLKWVVEKLKPLMEDPKIGKCGQNCKFDAAILKRKGMNVTPIVFDSMIASYILDPDQKHNLDILSQRWLNYTPVSIKTLIGEKKSKQISMREINPKDIKDYAAEDSDVALQLRNKLYPELKKDKKLYDLAVNIEFPVVEVLTDMEYNGVAIDKDALKQISEKIEGEAKASEKKIFDFAGEEFNIDSPKQLGEILFEKLQLPVAKKTKTGYSTDVEVLTKLAENYPIATHILDYRSLVKLKSTYVDSLPKLINPKTGRIHTSYNQTVASTGRLSSTDPNLQNIPIRSKLGKEIRKAFVAGSKNNVIFAADYSQVELRIMAHICGDENMINGFKKGLDIHAATAAVLYDKSLDEVNDDMRRIAKTVNFGIMYGLGPYGLSQRLNIPRQQSKEIIENYFEKYKGIKKYIDMTIESCREKGYSETLMGRRRYFPDINSNNHNLRTGAERGAINMPIQGTAADMMKIAMVSIHKEMKKLNMKSLMTVQVHDELIFDTDKSELLELKQLVKEHMENALPLGEVPVVVDTGEGDNWFEAH